VSDRERLRDIDQRLTHLLEQLEAIEADPRVERDPVKAGATAILDQLEAELRDIKRRAQEVLEDDVEIAP
jgi:hypothetical protein